MHRSEFSGYYNSFFPVVCLQLPERLSNTTSALPTAKEWIVLSHLSIADNDLTVFVGQADI